MFDYRLASLLGRTVAEMRASLTQREYLGWQQYWRAEPWGPWRDNLHAALLAREIRRPQLRKGAKVALEDFMVRDPTERQREATAGFIGFLKSVAKKVQR
jgi:hypothetical protein